jgi:hypothetical protein
MSSKGVGRVEEFFKNQYEDQSWYYCNVIDTSSDPQRKKLLRQFKKDNVRILEQKENLKSNDPIMIEEIQFLKDCLVWIDEQWKLL